MNVFRSVVLSILLASSLVSAKIRIDGISYNSTVLKEPSELVVSLSETKAQYYDDIRLEVTLTETNIIVFDLAKKDENHSFVSFYRTAIVSPEKETEIGFASTSGSILVVRVSEIKE